MKTKLTFCKLRRRLYKKYKRLCKLEFSKKIAIVSVVLMFFSISISFHLSNNEKDPVSDIATAVITTCGGYLCTYGIKSAFEKNSRNKYGIDKDGIPYRYYTDEEEEEK